MLSSTASDLGRAVQNHPALSRPGVRERLFPLWFRGLVYTQIWEDPRVDAEALRIDESSRLLTIASAGCNVLNYLTHEPKRIGAVDVIFFSYVLSVTPAWPAALGTALSLRAPDGRLYVVDFWDQVDLSDWIDSVLQGWLSLFDVVLQSAVLRKGGSRSGPSQCTTTYSLPRSWKTTPDENPHAR